MQRNSEPTPAEWERIVMLGRPGADGPMGIMCAYCGEQVALGGHCCAERIEAEYQAERGELIAAGFCPSEYDGCDLLDELEPNVYGCDNCGTIYRSA